MEDDAPTPVFGRKHVSILLRSDAHLARRAAKGDERAYAEIFERHGQELYRYARAILGNPEDAQDALQNTMVRVLRALPGEKRKIALRPWLYRVTRNESLSLIRARVPAAELTEDCVPPELAADIQAEHREEVRTLVADLATLPEMQRSALVLHELSGLSHEQVSEAMQRSPRASRQAIYEARLALQDLREGRDMDCDYVRSLISEGDGRVMRGRKVRSHLRGCRGCSDFELGIRYRRAQLGLLAPPLPTAAASGLIAATLGGGVAGTGLAGAGSGALGATGGSVALKSIGIVGASLAIGAGGAGLAGVDLPLGGEGKKPGSSTGERSPAPDATQPETTGAQKSSSAEVIGSEDAPPRGRERAGRPPEKGFRSSKPRTRRGPARARSGSSGPANASPGSAAGGASAIALAGSGKPDAPPGQAVSEERSSSGGDPAATPDLPEQAQKDPSPIRTQAATRARTGSPAGSP